MGDIVIKYETTHGVVELSPEIVKKYLVNGNGNITDQEIMLILQLCKYQKLNPFIREAYLIKYGTEPATMVVGKDVFTKRAAGIPDFIGYQAGVVVQKKSGQVEYRNGTLVLSDETLVGGWARVYRKNWQAPLELSVSLKEYIRYRKDGTPMQNWRTMPATMIRKVALVQALREAFPSDFQGLYSEEEMPVDGSELPRDIINVEAASAEKDARPFEENSEVVERIAEPEETTVKPAVVDAAPPEAPDETAAADGDAGQDVFGEEPQEFTVVVMENVEDGYAPAVDVIRNIEVVLNLTGIEAEIIKNQVYDVKGFLDGSELQVVEITPKTEGGASKPAEEMTIQVKTTSAVKKIDAKASDGTELKTVAVAGVDMKGNQVVVAGACAKNMANGKVYKVEYVDIKQVPGKKGGSLPVFVAKSIQEMKTA